MNEIKEAVIIMSKCPKAHKTFGIRSEKLGRNQWKFTWAFPLKESSAAREGYDKTSINGDIQFSYEYPGCPFCGSKYFIVCQCGHLSCNPGFSSAFTCEWCGMKGTLEAYTGGRIIAGMDA